MGVAEALRKRGIPATVARSLALDTCLGGRSVRDPRAWLITRVLTRRRPRWTSWRHFARPRPDLVSDREQSRGLKAGGSADPDEFPYVERAEASARSTAASGSGCSIVGHSAAGGSRIYLSEEARRPLAPRPRARGSKTGHAGLSARVGRRRVCLRGVGAAAAVTRQSSRGRGRRVRSDERDRSREILRILRPFHEAATADGGVTLAFGARLRGRRPAHARRDNHPRGKLRRRSCRPSSRIRRPWMRGQYE